MVSLCLSIFIEAIERFIEKKAIEEVNILLIVGCIGLAINLIGLVIFGHGHSHGLPSEAVKKLEELEGGFDDEDEIEVPLNAINNGVEKVEEQVKSKANSLKKEKKTSKCCAVLCKFCYY